MRLTGGRDRGRILKAPRGMKTRPSSDRMRESLFSILGPMEGLTILDCFAGAGTLGLEALSRGADAVCFIERWTRACAIIRNNVDALGYRARTHILARDLPGAIDDLRRKKMSFDLIFMDPPYGKQLVARTLSRVAEADILRPEGLIVCEHDRDDEDVLDIGALELRDRRRYGRTILSFLGMEREDDR